MRIPLLALFCALFVSGGCAHRDVFGHLEPPDVTLANLVPVGASPFEARVRADLRLQNPNDFPITFDGMRFDLEVNEQPFLRAVSDQEITLPRLGEAVVSVEGTTTTVSLWRQIRGLASDPAAGIRYRMEGRLFAIEPRRTGVDFEREGKIEGWGGSP
ncbi:MAG: LEA type 2 family protein [Myxococcota bacterium]